MAPTNSPQIPELIPGIRADVPPSSMRVRKRNGAYEPVLVDKIIRAVERCAAGLSSVDPMRVAIKTIGGLYDGSTTKELDLLYVFLSSANRVLSRPYLIERVWGYNYFGSPRTVDVHVRRLREKLAVAAKYITTIPCVGYKLVPPGGEMRR